MYICNMTVQFNAIVLAIQNKELEKCFFFWKFPNCMLEPNAFYRFGFAHLSLKVRYKTQKNYIYHVLEYVTHIRLMVFAQKKVNGYFSNKPWNNELWLNFFTGQIVSVYHKIRPKVSKTENCMLYCVTVKKDVPCNCN